MYKTLCEYDVTNCIYILSLKMIIKHKISLKIYVFFYIFCTYVGVQCPSILLYYCNIETIYQCG